MNGFADIHTHILPGVDDGASDLQEACRLLHMAWQDGIRAILLTPHCGGPYKQSDPARLKECFSAFCQFVANEFPDIRLYLGSEVYFETETPEKLLEGTALSLNDSQYVLLEFRPGVLRSQIIAGVSEVVRYGFTPIIAHAERCAIFRKDLSLVDTVQQMGALLQINAGSVMGEQGFAVKRFCHRLLKRQKVHFVASDAHNETKRPPLVGACYARVCKKYGQAYGERIFSENPLAVIENRVL